MKLLCLSENNNLAVCQGCINNVVKNDIRWLFGETADHFGHDILALEIADDHM